jgi:hypothetical protein
MPARTGLAKAREGLITVERAYIVYHHIACHVALKLYSSFDILFTARTSMCSACAGALEHPSSFMVKAVM